MAYGKKVWIFPDAVLPPEGVNLIPGHKNIYLIPHYQTKGAGLIPMTIACHKAAKKVTMEYMEKELGVGWWGSDAYATYYEDMGSKEIGKHMVASTLEWLREVIV